MRHNVTAGPWAPVQAQPQGLPPGAELAREGPSRPASVASDVGVPLLQAAVSGGLVAGLLTFAAARLGYGGDLLTWWAGWALGISAVAWVILLGQHRRLLWQLERVTHLDLDGDRRVGEPAERLVIVNAGQAGARAGQAAKAQERSNFAAFVAALPTRGTDLRTWEGELGRPTYQRYRDTLIRLGWARWKGKGKRGGGWELAQPIDDILARISG